MSKNKTKGPERADSATLRCSLRVYRLQDREGRGPFRPGFSEKWAEDWMPPALSSIPPFAELAEMETGKFRGFGCEKIEDLRNWICAEEFIKLKRMGFRLVSIEVDEIHWRDEFNCFFSRSKPLRFRTTKERLQFSANSLLDGIGV